MTGTCEACSSETERIHLHHTEYPQAVEDRVPLCPRCHKRVHAGHIPEPRTGRKYPRGRIVAMRPPSPILSRPHRHPPVDLVPLRAHLGVSQSELARLLGTSHVTINRAEQGHTRLTGLPALLTDLLARACETTDGADLHRRLQDAGGRAIDVARVLIESTEPTVSRMRKGR